MDRRRARGSAPLALEILVQVVEESRAASEPALVLFVSHRDPGDQPIDARSFRAAELGVLQIDIVYDLRDRRERGVVDAEAIDQHLEGAPVPFVRELRFEHVEADLARERSVTFSGDELEAAFRIDEAADEPGAGHAVDVNPLAGDPGLAFEALRAGRRKLDSGPARLFPHARLDSMDQPFDRLAAGRAEEIQRDDLREALPQPGGVRFGLRAPAVWDLFFGRRRFLQPPGLPGEPPVVRLPRGLEQGLYLPVGKTVDKTGLTNRSFALARDDLPQDPLEVFLGLIGPGQNVDGVFDRDRAEALEPAPDLHPEVIRLGRQLVNEQQPAAFGFLHIRHAGVL